MKRVANTLVAIALMSFGIGGRIVCIRRAARPTRAERSDRPSSATTQSRTSPTHSRSAQTGQARTNSCQNPPRSPSLVTRRTELLHVHQR